MSFKYTCEKCGKGFKQKSHYQTHLKKKNPCVQTSTLDKMVKEKVYETIQSLKETSEIRTYTQLYEFLQSYTSQDIREWLSQPWKGKDKQESLFRLFSGLGLLPCFSEYSLCQGNFNLQTIEPMKTLRSFV